MLSNFPNDPSISIPGPQGLLETVFTAAAQAGELASENYIAVICHPHPSHGGTMDNKVVTTLMRAYRDIGVAVVRFNFRGVGKSAGSFDQGRGELDDLLAVVAWIKQQLPASKLLLAGFSFGSAIAAQASYHCAGLRHLLLVAPPVERYSYDRQHQFDCPICVIQGDKDERVVAEGVYQWLASLQSPVELLRYPDASHFFHGYLTELKKDVARVLLTHLLSSPQT